MESWKKERTVLGAIILFASMSFILITIETFPSIMSSSEASHSLYNIGRFMGLVGFLCLSALIFSGETARFFDRFFGMDRIIKFQRRFSLITGVIVIFHPIFFIISDTGMASFLIPGYINLTITLGAVSLYIMLAVLIASHLYKLISYKAWQVIHIIIYGLFAMSAYHAMGGTAYSTNPSIRILFWVIITLMGIGMSYRTARKIKEHINSRYVVESVRDENSNTFSIRASRKDSKKMNFNAGQFCFLRIDKNKLHARHPFTISSSPEDNQLQFTIKKAGRFTRTAYRMRSGEKINIDGPYGRFYLEDDGRDVVFIAGGVGITPFRSMIKQMSELGTSRKVRLIYCCRHKKDILFKELFDSIDESWFRRIYVLSRENGKLEDSQVKGHLNEHILRESMRNLKDPMFYICGPESMKGDAVKMLSGQGVQNNSIKIEDFFW